MGRYDGDRTGTIDFAEINHLFADIGESLEAEEIKSLVTKVMCVCVFGKKEVIWGIVEGGLMCLMRFHIIG